MINTNGITSGDKNITSRKSFPKIRHLKIKLKKFIITLFVTPEVKIEKNIQNKKHKTNQAQ